MKRLLFLLVLLTIALVGCKSEEQVDGKQADDGSEVADVDSSDEKADEPDFSYITPDQELNKREINLFETDKGNVTLVGEKIDSGDSNTATLALEYDGELAHLWNEITPNFRLVTDAGEVFERYKTEPRVIENGLYIVYTFENVKGEKIERIDYALDKSNGDTKLEKVILEDTEETLLIPGIVQHTSTAQELPTLVDDQKEIEITELNYDGEGKLHVSASVTFNEDKKLDSGVYVYEPLTKNLLMTI